MRYAPIRMVGMNDGGAMTTTPVGLDRELDTTRLITRFERTIVERLDAALRAGGATIEEWRVLSFLGANAAGRAMTEIAEFALIPPPSLTKIVDRMVSLNLVVRKPDTEDRRRILVFASDRGRRVLEDWTAIARRERDNLAETVGSEEMALLATLIQRANSRLP